jgi:TolB-like protein/Tfp pilus assembly protein PilF
MDNRQRKLAAIMFTDIAGFSAVSNRDENLALALLREHNELLRPIFHAYNGREIKTIGDAFLLEFSSALESISCAVELQRRLAAKNEKEDVNRRIKIRIGIHLGDVIFLDNDVFGDGVNIASRIEPLAAPGGICFSRQIYDQIRNKIKEELVSAGHHHLKSIEEPVEIFYVKLPWDKAATTVAAPSGPAPAKSVVVLPFTDMSREKDQEYFCDGIAEDIIGALSKVEGVKTVARSSAFAFKNKDMDIRNICTALNVENVIEGSVRKSGNKVRITSQFIKASDGCQIWSEKYDRDLEDIFAIQDEISFAVVDNLKIKLLGETKAKIAKSRTENIAAYTTYLKGRYFWNRRRRGDMEKSLQFFHQAIALDPAYAQPYIGIADTFTLLGTYGFLPPTEAYSQAKDYARQALDLDQDLGDAYASIAWITATYDYDRAKAIPLFEKARALNPGSPYAHSWYALYLLGLGRCAEAAREMERALELDPLSMVINANMGMIHSFSGDQEQAIEQYHKALEIDGRFALTHLWLGMAYLGAGDPDQAVASFKESIALAGDTPLALGYLGLTCALYNRRPETENIRQRFAKLTDSASQPYCAALIQVGKGDYDRAFALLNQACAERAPLLIYLPSLPTLMPALAPFTTDPRFYGVLKRMDLRD